MKRFLLSVFLIFAGFSVFAQSYDDWDKLFTENRKDDIEETYCAVAASLENGNYPEIMKSIFGLYAAKCEIAFLNNEDFSNTLSYNSNYDIALKEYSSFTFKSNINNFINCIKDKDLFVYSVTDLNKYDTSAYFQPVSVRELELIPAKYEGKQVEVTGRYQYTSFNTASFLCFDSADGWKVINFPYSDLVAMQLIDITKNDSYKLCGTVTNGKLIIEYLELY